MSTRTPSDIEPDEELDVDEPEPESFNDEVDDDAWDEDVIDTDDADDELEGEELETGEDDEDDEEEGESTEALDELEAEELDMLTDDEASETLIVDEAQELRAIRRAELQLNEQGTGGRLADEFQCQSCFLVLKISQLADKRRMLCKDCAD